MLASDGAALSSSQNNLTPAGTPLTWTSDLSSKGRPDVASPGALESSQPSAKPSVKDIAASLWAESGKQYAAVAMVGKHVLVWRDGEAMDKALELIELGVNRANPAAIVPFIACVIPNADHGAGQGSPLHAGGQQHHCHQR